MQNIPFTDNELLEIIAAEHAVDVLFQDDFELADAYPDGDEGVIDYSFVLDSSHEAVGQWQADVAYSLFALPIAKRMEWPVDLTPPELHQARLEMQDDHTGSNHHDNAVQIAA